MGKSTRNNDVVLSRSLIFYIFPMHLSLVFELVLCLENKHHGVIAMGLSALGSGALPQGVFANELYCGV